MTLTNSESTGPSIPTWTLGDRIMKARKHAGMEQSDLASALNLSGSMISKWERDAREPRVSMLRRIAELTDVDEQWLLNGGGTVSRFRGRPRLGVVEGGRRGPTQPELFPRRLVHISRVK